MSPPENQEQTGAELLFSSLRRGCADTTCAGPPHTLSMCPITCLFSCMHCFSQETILPAFIQHISLWASWGITEIRHARIANVHNSGVCTKAACSSSLCETALNHRGRKTLFFSAQMLNVEEKKTLLIWQFGGSQWGHCNGTASQTVETRRLV